MSRMYIGKREIGRNVVIVDDGETIGSLPWGGRPVPDFDWGNCPLDVPPVILAMAILVDATGQVIRICEATVFAKEYVRTWGETWHIDASYVRAWHDAYQARPKG